MYKDVMVDAGVEAEEPVEKGNAIERLNVE